MAWNRPGARDLRRQVRRRGTAPVGAVVLLACAMLGACSTGGPSPTAGPTPTASPSATTPSARTPTPTPSPPGEETPTPTSPGKPSVPTAAQCARDTLGTMDDGQLAGQLILMGIPSTYLPASARTVLADDHIGGIFMFGNSSAGVRATRELTDAARSADRDAHLMVTADQEGGQVQRLRGTGFDRMPPAIDQAELSDRTLAQRAERWGGQLDEAGVDTDLAPVADVVPADVGAANEPIYALQRGYGSTTGAVSPKVVAFVEGMHAAGRGTALKHFPGLGQVRGNTDFARDVTDTRTTRSDPLLSTFRDGIAAHTDMVMIALATYTRIDAHQPAAFSTTIVSGMLRGDLGFDGVVVSDDMNALQVRDMTASDRAWRFLDAGGDLVTIGDAGVADRMVRAIRDRMSRDDAARQRVHDSALRVLTMKARLGLLGCR